MNTENVAEKDDETLFAELMGEAGNAAPAPAAEPQGPSNEPGEGEPAAAGETQPAPAGEAEPASSVASDDANVPEWLRALPAEQRTAAESAWREMVDSSSRLQNDLSRERQARGAAEGRLRSLQQPRHEPPPQEHRAPAPEPAQGNSDTSLDAYFASEGWKKFADEFPDEAAIQRAAIEHVAKVNESRIASLEQKFAKAQLSPDVVNTLTETAATSELNKQISLLEAAHPDWKEIDQSPEFVEWVSEWRSRQPRQMAHLYGNEDTFRSLLRDAEFTTHLLDEFKRDVAAADLYLSSQQPGNTQNTPPAEAPAAATNTGSALTSLTRTPDVKGSPAPRTGSISGLSDAEQFDILFNGGNKP